VPALHNAACGLCCRAVIGRTEPETLKPGLHSFCFKVRAGGGRRALFTRCVSSARELQQSSSSVLKVCDSLVSGAVCVKQSSKLKCPADVSEETLNNVACLVITLKTPEREVARANVVVKVDRPGKEAMWVRSMFNPLLP
jgi:hypothetical protein